MLQHLVKTFSPTQCLSQTPLWQIISDYYAKAGEKAWERSIPYTVTNSTLTARHHALSIITHAKQLTYKKSSYLIIDYGAGIGQHAYLLAKALTELAPKHNIPVDMFEIRMADISPYCLTFWKKHPRLQPYIAQNLITMTQLSGDWLPDLQKITQGEAGYHCLIANYLLDSMPFVAYAHGQRQGVALQAPRMHLTPSFTGPLSSISLKISPHPSTTPHPYPLLEERYQDTPRYTIPTTAIAFINQFFAQTTNAITLINDKCFLTPEDINYDEQFNIDFEGCFSTTVNLDALLATLPPSLHVQQTATHYPVIQTICISHSPQPPINFPSCTDAAALFHHYKSQDSIPASLCISIANIMQYDPFCLELFSQSIIADHTSSQTLMTLVQQCLSNHFQTPASFTLLHTAKIFRRTNYLSHSLHFLQQYIDQHPPHPAYFLELGILYTCMGRTTEALPALKKALTDPLTHNSAKQLIQTLTTQSTTDEN